MEFMKSFMDQSMIAMMGEIVLFANTVTMAMPTRWRENMLMDMMSKFFNFLAMNVFHNRNMDDIPVDDCQFYGARIVGYASKKIRAFHG